MSFTSEEIKTDLKNLNINDFYFKYIIKSSNWYFADYQHTPPEELIDKMDTFKEIISKSFNVSFHSAQIVGSAKLGVSLSPNKAFKKFIANSSSEFEKESDIDIAIISDSLFLDIWEKLRKGKKEFYIPRYTNITSSIFSGFIDDKNFKDLDFLRKEWEEKISYSNIKLQSDISIMHSISYRIYRTWEDLQDYQLSGIKELKEKVMKNEF